MITSKSTCYFVFEVGVVGVGQMLVCSNYLVHKELGLVSTTGPCFWSSGVLCVSEKAAKVMLVTTCSTVDNSEDLSQ